jgi:hypothetical protein
LLTQQKPMYERMIKTARVYFMNAHFDLKVLGHIFLREQRMNFNPNLHFANQYCPNWLRVKIVHWLKSNPVF